MEPEPKPLRNAGRRRSRRAGSGESEEPVVPTPQALEGITVIDCGQVVAGPLIATVLSDFGANVIKIENPSGGDSYRFFGPRKHGVPVDWKYLARNKKSITLSLSHPEGQHLLCRLIERSRADILVESFRPGTLERWGLPYEHLRSFNPGLILVRVSGFGQSGPYRNRPGFGTLAEAMSGFAHVTGMVNGPPTLPPFPLADSVAALYGTIGALMALYHRDKHDGAGQCIDVSLLEPLFNILGAYVVDFDQLGLVAGRIGNRTGVSAPRGTYQASDGSWVALAASTQAIAIRLFNAMGRPELIDDPRFKSPMDRTINVDDIDAIVGEWVHSRGREEVVQMLIDHDVPIAPVLDVQQLSQDPHIIARGAIVEVLDGELGPIRMPNVTPILSQTPGRIRHAGPALGEHNWDIYHGVLGLDEAEIEGLKSKGVI